MPNFDTGHLFLTFLSPIRAGTTHDETGTAMSHMQALRIGLNLLPTALQSPATCKIGEMSPFARTRQTHLCRFCVIDDVIYNGRTPKDALVTSIMGEDPIDMQPADRLNCAYLFFSADIDAVMNDGDPLPGALDPAQQGKVRDAWLQRLWSTMEPELRSIYQNCVGFESVTDGAGFARYMRRCQIETTMPFNDYWLAPPKLSNLPVTAMAVAALVPAVATLLGLVGWLTGMATTPLLSLLVPWPPGWVALIGAALSAAVIYGLYRYVLANGQKPMPPGRYASLPSVLKSLYLQQNFADFAVENQGADAQSLHAAFGAFLDAHKPDNTLAPSQAPGVISVKAPGGLIT